MTFNSLHWWRNLAPPSRFSQVWPAEARERAPAPTRFALIDSPHTRTGTEEPLLSRGGRRIRRAAELQRETTGAWRGADRCSHRWHAAMSGRSLRRRHFVGGPLVHEVGVDLGRAHAGRDPSWRRAATEAPDRSLPHLLLLERSRHGSRRSPAQARRVGRAHAAASPPASGRRTSTQPCSDPAIAEPGGAAGAPHPDLREQSCHQPRSRVREGAAPGQSGGCRADLGVRLPTPSAPSRSRPGGPRVRRPAVGTRRRQPTRSTRPRRTTTSPRYAQATPDH
jgi:hypothetical protein